MNRKCAPTAGQGSLVGTVRQMEGWLMARTPKYYHHGKSPAAWAGSVAAAVGCILAAVGAMLGPNWALVIFGAGIVLLGGLATMVMKAMGLGQP